ncbi:hypothetical protein EON76_04865 [bacterium]|nr:MAG: hypothetical protein EON76_04865 [bacterium]
MDNKNIFEQYRYYCPNSYKLSLGIAALTLITATQHGSSVELQRDMLNHSISVEQVVSDSPFHSDLIIENCNAFLAREEPGDRTDAADCYTELKTNKIALIDFRGEDSNASSEELAAALTYELAADSDGLLTPEVISIKPDPVLAANYTSQQCEGGRESIADKVVRYQGDALRDEGFDKIVAMSGKYGCQDVPLGYAVPSHNRAVLTKSNDFSRNDLIRFAEHEIAHLYGIGHSATLTGGEYGPVLSDYMMLGAMNEMTIDVGYHLKYAEYETYGDSNFYSMQYSGDDKRDGDIGSIMGTPSYGDQMNDRFSNYHLQLLKEASQSVESFVADNQKVTRYPTDQASNSHITASIGNIGVEGFEDFTDLVVMPFASEAGFDRAEIMLTGRGTTETILLGTIFYKNVAEEGQFIPLDQHYLFCGMGATVDVTFDQGSISVEVLRS